MGFMIIKKRKGQTLRSTLFRL